jgi:periplasmic copper chaperone A
MKQRKLFLFSALGLACAAAQAHVVLEYQVAPAASSYKATFKVGHGCGASPTRQIAVSIPAGVRGAKPMPKPGWSLEVVREKLAQPYTDHGRTVTEDVTRITWTAKTKEDQLPGNYYDEFVLSARLPAKEGALYWPVAQVCEEGRTDWAEVPRPGQKLSDLKSPAALLEVLPSGGGHSH